MAEDAFVRWQERSGEALSAAHGLLIALALGLLVFTSNLLLESKLHVPLSAHVALATVGLCVGSLALGVLCSLSRMADLRLTASIARRREQEASDSDLQADRLEVERLGERTRRLFTWQLGLLFASGTALVLSLIVQWASSCPALQ